MNIFRAFMELDKLHEGYDDRQTLIGNLKSIGRNYNFDKYSTPQLFYIWQKESAKAKATPQISSDDFVDVKPARATCEECGCTLTDGGFCPKCDDGVEDLEESVKSEYHCSECGFTGLFYDEEVADGCCPNCHDHHGGFIKCDEALKETWADEKLAELRQKPRYAWTEEDWDDYNYCMNANAEVDYYNSLDEGIFDDLSGDTKKTGWVSRTPTQTQTQQSNPNQQSTPTPPPTTPPQMATTGTNVVTIVYDPKAHKLRARADDGVHGEANVAFPNNLRNKAGQQYEVDDLVWNGKNYRATGNIVAI